VTLSQLIETAIGVVDATVRGLPDELRELARQLPVHYEPSPGNEVIADGFEPDILGLFTGSPHGEETMGIQPSPPQILLYVESLWDYSGENAKVYRAEVRLTYLHELGHYFGWDEDEIVARGLD
jgi:predicted Zn-dependent protease with MMP-like domain